MEVDKEVIEIEFQEGWKRLQGGIDSNLKGDIIEANFGALAAIALFLSALVRIKVKQNYEDKTS